MGNPYLNELKWRGLFHQATAGEELEQHLATPDRVAYAGFDPTRNSLTIGNLIPIMLLTHFQQAGHKVIVLMGGGTGMIGDPSGKDSERQLMTADEVAANVAEQQKIMERLIDFDGGRATVVNNGDWLGKLGYIEVLRDVGKHFSVNAMIQKDSIRDRLHNREQGISYTEFSYILLQAYDFLHLKRERGCSLQMAGSDQYGNIVAGIDLIHRVLGREGEAGAAFGVTAPLVTRSDGQKIGKTEKGAIWLSADRTSPYAFYQFWLNADDTDVLSYLRWYTLLDRERVEAVSAEHAQAPEKRAAQRLLAQELTSRLHGDGECKRVLQASEALFSGNVRDLDGDMLGQVFADVPHSDHDRTTLEGEGVSLVDVLPTTSLAGSKREARQFLSTGAVSVNGEKVEADRRLTGADLLDRRSILIRRGKKKWHATNWA